MAMFASRKPLAALFASMAIALAAQPVPVSAAGKYRAVGDLNCAFAAGGTPNAVLCEYRSFAGGPVELYFALVDQASISRSANVQWDVLALNSSGAYKKGGLSGNYLAGAAGLSAGSLYSEGKDSLILQAREGTLEPGVSFFQLRPVK